MIHHRLVSLILLRMMRSIEIIRDIRHYIHAGDFQVLDPGVVLLCRGCDDEVDAGHGTFEDPVDAAVFFDGVVVD